MTKHLPTWLVLNHASGSNDAQSRDRLIASFAAYDMAIDRVICVPEDELPGPVVLREAGVGMIGVFTGDGTINSLVTGLFGWEGSVLVLPGGTMNLLSKRLHGDIPPEEILDRVAAGRARAIRPTILRCSQGAALVEIIAGPGTAWNEVREAMREADLAGLATSAAEAIERSLTSAMVVCEHPRCGREEGYAAIMLRPVEGGIETEGYYADSVGDVARQGWALLRRNFREGPHEKLGIFAEVTCASPDRGSVGLLMDGESAEGRPREHITIARCEVDLLATADAVR